MLGFYGNDHGKSFDGKNFIVIYGHVGKFKVKENDKISRGQIIAHLPEKVEFRCMARGFWHSPSNWPKILC